MKETPTHYMASLDWINSNKQQINDYEYILAVNIPKSQRKEITECLTAYGWKYSSALFNKLRKSGYKKLKNSR